LLNFTQNPNLCEENFIDFQVYSDPNDCEIIDVTSKSIKKKKKYRKYSKELKRKILSYSYTNSIYQASKKFRVSLGTLCYWRKKSRNWMIIDRKPRRDFKAIDSIL